MGVSTSNWPCPWSEPTLDHSRPFLRSKMAELILSPSYSSLSISTSDPASSLITLPPLRTMATLLSGLILRESLSFNLVPVLAVAGAPLRVISAEPS